MANARIFTPTNQIRLTNVAIVRLKKCGKRFEVACYKNKVVSWRNGTEKDINEVLQTKKVFTNVSKGELAKKDDIQAAFGSTDDDVVCKQIVEKGELQISEKERDVQLDSLFKEIATAVANMCVNPESKLPYPVTFIERSMKDIHYSVKPNKSAKQQALEVIPKLKEHMAIDRAKMRVKVTIQSDHASRVKSALHSVLAESSISSTESETEIIGVIEPGQFRHVEELVMKNSSGSGSVEVITLKEVNDYVGPSDL